MMNKKISQRIKGYILKKPNFEKILSYFLPENWVKNRSAYILFWTLVSFTVIFLIWASIAQVNQVVRASGKVIPDSQVHLVQSNLTGPVEQINVFLGDKVSEGDIMFLIDHKNLKNMYKLSSFEVETRERKVEILEELVQKGSDSEFRLLDERLALVESQKRNDATERQYNFSSIKAPVAGLVSKVNVSNIDQVIQQGSLLAEIVPEDDKLKIEAAVLPKDIAYVKIGQKAMVGFSAYDQAIYGRLEGTVTKVAANTTDVEELVYYPIIIEVDTHQTGANPEIKLQSGMISDVSVIGEERTVMSYIMNPITKLSQRALQE